MNTKFSNQYGTLELELISDVKKVSELGRVKDISDDNVFTMDEAEQIALITENKGIQMSFDITNMKRASVIVHETGKTGAWAKIKSMNFFKGVNAQEEIERLAKRNTILV